MTQRLLSAGLLLYRRRSGGRIEVLLAHPGGPFFAGKDEGVWTVPKGLVEEGEDPLAAARREFTEETGCDPGEGPFLDLGEVRQRSGKRVMAWAVEADCDPERARSNEFEMEWPPGSGRKQRFAEVDRVGFFDLEEAARKLNPAQVEFLRRLREALAPDTPPGPSEPPFFSPTNDR